METAASMHSNKTRLRRRVKKALGIGKKLQKKQGQLLYKGLPGYELMSRLQLGIRYSVSISNQLEQSRLDKGVGVVDGERSTPQPPHPPQALRPVKPEDFKAKDKVGAYQSKIAISLLAIACSLSV